ncbi:MAG: multidrug efflux RND transporter periplasmic adaptor subunit VexC [Bacteroidales bacterium]
MKKLALITVVILLASCAGKVETTGSREEILAQINTLKKEIAERNDRIRELEEELSKTEGSADNSIPVETIKVDPQPFKHYIEVTGDVEAAKSAYISPEINGQIKKIHVVEGQWVKQGDLLFEINSEITQSTIAEVETSLELARTVFEKQKELWEKKIGSEIDFLRAKNNVQSLESRLETLRTQLEMAQVTAPFDGIIDEIWVKEGELAVPGQRIMLLVNLRELYVNADVSEAYLMSVHKGDQVIVTFPSYPGLEMEVPVYRTGNTINPGNRTFTLQLKITNRDNIIKPNSLARIKINDFSADSALLVPAITVKNDLNGSYLYKVVDNKAVKTYVTPGRSYNDQIMITEGLNPGDQVIVAGYNQVSNGVPVAILKRGV